MGKNTSIAKRSLRLTGCFEAELLVSLLLAKWNHPLASDSEFSLALLESAAEVLQASVHGERLFQEISPANVNLIAALWYAEATTLSADPSIASVERTSREAWLEALRRSIPSCFCEPDLLM
jgi:hypothetical protein